MTDESVKNIPHWQSADTHPELNDKFKVAMREIVDPELGMNIIQLGLVRDLIIEEDHADLKMILTTPFCPYGPSMIEETRVKAEEALGIPTRIDLMMDPWDFSMMEEGFDSDWGLYR
jgi:metal-sulfur cluster biosynthetic enzyme